MAEFARAYHRAVSRVLHALNGTLLERAECYFGGGMQLALAIGECRESRDVAFLVSRHAGYRLLRDQVSSNSLGQNLVQALPLAREVRADREGIRTRPAHARHCIATLGIVDRATLRKGLRALARLATQSSGA